MMMIVIITRIIMSDGIGILGISNILYTFLKGPLNFSLNSDFNKYSIFL